MITPDITRLPPPSDDARARDLRSDWLAASEAHTDSVQAFARMAAADAAWTAVLDSVFGNSPFLAKLVLDHPDVLAAFAHDGPDAVFARMADEIGAEDYADISAAMLGLRKAKARVALLIALADITEAWTVDRVVEALSIFADASVRSAVRTLLRAAQRKGDLQLPDPNNPEAGSGYVVLAVGKLGGRELNYSSDIDLFVFYDEQKLT